MVNTVRSLGDPRATLQNAMSQNPRLKSIVDQAGGDYQKAFYAYSKELGVDGEQILSLLK